MATEREIRDAIAMAAYSGLTDASNHIIGGGQISFPGSDNEKTAFGVTVGEERFWVEVRKAY